MKLLRSLILIALCCSTAAAQGKKLTQREIDKATDEGMKKLQGLWAYESGEANGGGRWTLSTERIYIESNSLHHVKKTGELIWNGDRCEFSIDPSKNPVTIELVRKNGSPGQKIHGIFKIEGDKLTIATNTNDKDTPPEKFSTKLTAGKMRATNLQTYKKVTSPAPEQPPKKTKLTEKEIRAAADKALKELQGQWVYEKHEQNGFPYWTISNVSIYIERNVLREVKKNGDLIFNGSACEISVDPTSGWNSIDLVRKNGSPGTKVLGIFKVDGNRLIIATNPASADDPRPKYFTTKLTAGLDRATVVQTFKRVVGPEVEKPKEKGKMTQAELDAANAKALKELQGQWTFEKAERNGFSYWVLPEESIYIEKNLLRECRKNGDLIFNGSACELTLDASKPYVAIDLIRKNGSPGQKVLGIVKVDGDRLTIATNTADDNKDIRPGQFTVRLTAGLERAAVVQTYKRAKK